MTQLGCFVCTHTGLGGTVQVFVQGRTVSHQATFWFWFALTRMSKLSL
ncbi:hypothetical protein KOR42_19320 [Thalassoglobus neptunius]|uniref:Uncharacterized protein n=1 Tax=Thalassoglobus neptunius TaxID=1938619 RepID=A0A5C5X879_9PLAN|nr:hypothetical protein KOR42_19320 [Thalassoglobus neptunius]